MRCSFTPLPRCGRGRSPRPATLSMRRSCSSTRMATTARVSIRPVNRTRAGGGPRSDEVGIVVSARGVDDRGYVLADRSIQGVLTDVWAQLAIGAYYEFNGHRLIAEVNYGGDMVRDVIQTRAPGLPVDVVHATHGKQVRAEPAAA